MKVGVLGGGQLAKMLAVPAQQLNVELVCVDPNEGSCASTVTNVVTASFDDHDSIDKAFADVDCVTFETENLPFAAVEAISKRFKLLPSLDALKVFQDRLLEKDYLNSAGIPTADYINVTSWEDIESFELPFIIKTRRSGYDGKGQAMVRNLEDAKKAWQELQGQDLIAEKFVPFDFEASIISARNTHGSTAFYPLTHNQHQNGILRLSKAPLDNAKLESLARQYATSLMEKINYVGVMAIEFFCVNDTLVANEVAPRVHNSGHWTIEGAETSQFENHIRAICGMPLGSTNAKGFSAMINIIGTQPDAYKLSAIPGAHYHWYGKEPRAGRKLGHLTLCAASEDELGGAVMIALKNVQY